ncbi:PhzF family phenazine biosynthesis protein [Pseudomonas sp. PIC25]|uniref:PhzF family phenazine biosynthesis protein n=1 Tax=Pseudomonas sp. PIC25 TaxID=1958773 RepID=UPI00211540F7|nr:PhzF family phenazine biosynthesis protein [Pseudomonas sp. PIC25]
MVMHYWQMDVFAERPLTGNGLAVFDDARGLSTATMQALTQELRQFESLFLLPGEVAGEYAARIFTVEEELPFAGHPILGAAALLHYLHEPGDNGHWRLRLSMKTVELRTRRQGQGFYAEMDQGEAEWGVRLSGEDARLYAEAFSLAAGDLDARYPVCVVSTGLPYLLLPVNGAALIRARQNRADLDRLLADIGAAFVYLLDVDALEGRTWDPLGVVEDVATGSAAGPVAAYLVEHRRCVRDEPFVLNQGRFVGRPSRIDLRVGTDNRVRVGGTVQLLSRAELLVNPSLLA